MSSRLTWFTSLNPSPASALIKFRTFSNLLATSAIFRTPLQELWKSVHTHTLCVCTDFQCVCVCVMPLTPSLTHGWPLLENRPGWFPWEKGRTRRRPHSRHEAGPAQRIRCVFQQEYVVSSNNRVDRQRTGNRPAENTDTLTLAMSQIVTSLQAAARSKLCTLFFTLRAILQSPQPKSATTREGGLEGNGTIDAFTTLEH